MTSFKLCVSRRSVRSAWSVSGHSFFRAVKQLRENLNRSSLILHLGRQKKPVPSVKEMHKWNYLFEFSRLGWTYTFAHLLPCAWLKLCTLGFFFSFSGFDGKRTDFMFRWNANLMSSEFTDAFIQICIVHRRILSSVSCEARPHSLRKRKKILPVCKSCLFFSKSQTDLHIFSCITDKSFTKWLTVQFNERLLVSFEPGLNAWK